MKSDRPSETAAFVAACRGLTDLLPQEARLCQDPFGLRFGGRLAGTAARFAARAPRLAPHAVPRRFLQMLAAMQIRTRVLDDALLRFVASGGRQVLLLGAGFDCRAARLRRELIDTVVFEVDHPATQAKKRRILGETGAPSAPVVYLPWDFEHDPMAALPARLALLGHDATRTTLTIWEGVTMYLTEAAIDATVRAVRALSAPRSPFALTYLERAALDSQQLGRRLISRWVARVGEPFRFGWDPAELPGWLGERGFSLVSDRHDAELARELFPPHLAQTDLGEQRHIVVAERCADA